MQKLSLFSITYFACIASALVNYSQFVTAQTQIAAPATPDCGSDVLLVCDQSTIQIDLDSIGSICGGTNTYWWRNENEAVPGISNAWLYQFCNGDTAITFWTDQNPDGYSWEMQPADDGTLDIKGEVNVDDSLCYDFEIKSSLPNEETVTIAGIDFDQSAGRLFLISTERNEVNIKQLDNDLTGASAFDTKSVAIRNPDINSFFTNQVSSEDISLTNGIRGVKQDQCGGDSIMDTNVPFYSGSLRDQ